MMINGHNNEYLVMFGTDRYYPDAHRKTCKHRFSSIKDARKFAHQFTNASIYKFHYEANGDAYYYTEADWLPKKRM